MQQARQGAGQRTCRNRDHAVCVCQNFEWLIAGEDQRDLVGYGIHLIPRSAVGIGFRAAGELLRAGLGVAKRNHRLRASEIRVSRR